MKHYPCSQQHSLTYPIYLSGTINTKESQSHTSSLCSLDVSVTH